MKGLWVSSGNNKAAVFDDKKKPSNSLVVSTAHQTPQRSLFAGGISLTHQGASVSPTHTFQLDTISNKKDEPPILDKKEESTVSSSPNTHTSVVVQKDGMKAAWKTKLESILEFWAFQVFILIVTVWAIFGDDVRLLLFRYVPLCDHELNKIIRFCCY